MAKAGPMEQFISQTQPFLLQGPDTCLPCNLSEPLTREGGVGEATMEAHMSKTTEYYVANNILKDSKDHCKKTVISQLQIPVMIKGQGQNLHINNSLSYQTQKQALTIFKFWSLSVWGLQGIKLVRL